MSPLSWDSKRAAVALDIMSVFKTRRKERKVGATKSSLFYQESKTLEKSTLDVHCLGQNCVISHFQLSGKLDTLLFQEKMEVL